MAGSAYEYFFQILGDWGSSIPLESQWFAYFDLQGIPALKGDVGNAIKFFDSSPQWKIGSTVVEQLKKNLYNPPIESLLGCVFARQVNLPGETINSSASDLKYGGYLGPVTTSNREGYNKFSITFNETNASFLDFIMRPWTILVGYNGLVARSKGSSKNVKCPMVKVVFLAKTGAKSPMTKRKIITFYNVAPVSIEDQTNTYAADGLMYNKVEFVYDYYDVSEGDSPDFFQSIVVQPSVPSTSPNTTKSPNNKINENSGNGVPGSTPRVKTSSYTADNPPSK
jgi:hypothetical protein